MGACAPTVLNHKPLRLTTKNNCLFGRAGGNGYSRGLVLVPSLLIREYEKDPFRVRYCRWLVGIWQFRTRCGRRLTKPATIHFRCSCDSLGLGSPTERAAGSSHPLYCTLDPAATDRTRRHDRRNVVRPAMAPPRLSGSRFLTAIVTRCSLVTRDVPLCKT